VGLLARIRKGGRLIACIETENVRGLIEESKVPVLTYSRFERDHADYTFRNLKNSQDGIEFDVFFRNQHKDSLRLKLSGEHNALNALSVYIECVSLGLSSKEITEGLASFEGVKRRQEERGEVGGVLVIDDFAHHPTAVRETLKALHQKYPKRRLLTVFEPRSATSRRKVFQNEYTEAFGDADASFIAVAYDQSKIPTDQQFSSQELVEGLRKRNRTASFFESVDEGVKQVANFSQSGDVIAVLSNGGFGGFIPKLLSALQK